MGTEEPAGSESPEPQGTVGMPTSTPPTRALRKPHEPGSRPSPLRGRASSPVPAAGAEPSLADHVRKDGRRPRRRDQLLWLWPVCAVAVMALAGQFFGAYGALLSAVVVAATLVLLIGEPDVISVRTRMWVGAFVVVMAAGVVVGRYSGVDFLTAPPHAVEPVDLRGKVVDADDIRGRNLRDALLQGAVLDGLDLRGHDLTGVRAQGTSFRRTVLDDARLVDADLRGADFTNACLEHADLSGARLDGVVADGANVREAVVEGERVAEAASWPQPDTSAVAHCG